MGEHSGTNLTPGDLRMVAGQVVSLKEHLEKQLKAVETYFIARLEALAKATDLQADAQKASFAGVNEFRSSLNDYTKLLVTRTEMNLMIDKLDQAQAKMNKDIEELRKFQAQLEGKASQSSVDKNFIFTAITLVIAIVGLLLKFT